MSDAISTPRASLGEWAQAALLAANLAWTTLCLGGYRPETMVVTSALNGLLLAAHLLDRAGLGTLFTKHDARDARAASAPAWHPAGVALLPFLAYAALNVAIVTPVRWLGWRDWLGWAQMIAVFWVVLNGVRSRGPQRLLVGALLGVACASAALAIYQHFFRADWLMLGRTQSDQYLGRASGSFGNPNSLGALVILLLPTAGVLAWRARSAIVRATGWGVAVVLSAALAWSVSRGAWLGLAAAFIAWPLVAGGGIWRKKILAAAAALGGVAACGAVLFAVSPVVRERLAQLVADSGERSRPIVWRAAWELFCERPVLGTGGGSYNVLFEAHRPVGF
ncbi:MAG: hypothetical protein RLZZ15_440, partial [Verrucomicrobiota bacterium]